MVCSSSSDLVVEMPNADVVASTRWLLSIRVEKALIETGQVQPLSDVGFWQQVEADLK